jgi:hypothetical protein
VGQTRAHPAEDVRLEDGPGGAAQIVLGDPLDEGGDVDAGRARFDARRVDAVVAAVRLDQRRAAIERRMRLREISFVLDPAQPSGTDAVGLFAHGGAPLVGPASVL